ncbi:DUF6892 domain-containing protein [Aliidiomarina soli]|uniref:DUF6892 domain-containing protein n=1 Tax=Aliidiomarina soli TaxID=1928574 RepID=A0A432WM25_9GAMM|nr:hypothetical protein [Aliidiomarina soli]RUO34808.1 hypothetical protein CWE14_02075 [Aliidiomarina soli]
MEFNKFTGVTEGPDKDLNFAIKSGSKKTLNALEKLTGNLTAYDTPAKHSIALQLFSLAANVDLADKKASQVITAIGKYFLKLSESAMSAEFIANEWLNRLQSVDYAQHKECQAAYQWILLFNQRDGSKRTPHELVRVFEQSQDALAGVYQKLTASYSVDDLIIDNSGSQPGYYLMEAFLTTYFYHSHTCHSAYETWVLECVEKDMRFGNGLILAVLRRSGNYPEIAAYLIDVFIRATPDDNHPGMVWPLFNELLNDEDMPERMLKQVVAHVEPKISQWSVLQKDYAVRCLFSIDWHGPESVAKSLARSKSTTKLAKLLVADADGESIRALSALLDTDRGPAFKLPSGGENQFEDLNIKLMVIDELMYRKKSLAPAFNLREFAKNYDHSVISTNGYETIPEALSYMKGLQIPEHLLAEITQLSYDPARDIYHQLVPFWDGEDDRFAASSLADLAKLENIREIEGFDEHLLNTWSDLIHSKGIVRQR